MKPCIEKCGQTTADVDMVTIDSQLKVDIVLSNGT